MNHSIHSADRATHLKIVVVALVAGIAVAAFGIAARTNVDYSQTAPSHQSRQAGGGDELRIHRWFAKLGPAFTDEKAAFGRPFFVRRSKEWR